MSFQTPIAKDGKDEWEGCGCLFLCALIIVCITAYLIACLFAPK